MVPPTDAVDHFHSFLPLKFGEIMHRASRALSLSVVALVAHGACKKKPEVAPAPAEQPAPASQPAPPPPAPAQPECDAACVEARNNAAKAEAIRAATAALTATIYFDYDRSDITDDSRAKLDAKVPVLTQNTAVRIASRATPTAGARTSTTSRSGSAAPPPRSDISPIAVSTEAESRS